MMAAYPFPPDINRFELAMKEKAGQLWTQLVEATK